MGKIQSINDKLETIQYISEKSLTKQEKEDAFFINDALGCYGVLDGSTPLNDFQDEAGHNGAYLAANLFKTYFEEQKNLDSLNEAIINANTLLRQKMDHYDVNPHDKPGLWCTCISAVQMINNTLIYASLGDTMIITCDWQDQVNVVTVNTVKNVSARARLKREQDRKQGRHIPDETYFNKKHNETIYNRNMANIPNGYSVANGMKEAEQYIQSGLLETKNLKQILLMSDGLFDPQEDLRQVYAKVMSQGLETYIHELTETERTTGKPSDDKTALLLTMKH